MATTSSVSQADIDSLAQALATLRPQLPPTALTGQGPLQIFCQNWPTIKPILETLQPVVGSIPGVGAIISGAIATLLLVGNGAYKAFCGGQ
jgi:hypothetical protein